MNNTLKVIGYTLETWFFQLLVVLMCIAISGTAHEIMSAIVITGMILMDVLVTVVYVLAKMDLIFPSDLYTEIK